MDPLVAEVAKHTRLKQSATGRWWGLCPFHGERRASFNVDPAKGTYRCMGCNAFGNLAKFMREVKRGQYRLSLKYCTPTRRTLAIPSARLRIAASV